MLPFEGQEWFRAGALQGHEIDGLCADKLDVGAGGVEVGVVGDDVALFAHDVEEDALGGAALVGGDDVGVAEDVLDGLLEAVEALAAGVAFVAFHDRGPLVRGHGAGAGVGEQIDEHVVGVEQEEVVMRGAQQVASRWARVVQWMGSTLLMRKGSMMVLASTQKSRRDNGSSRSLPRDRARLRTTPGLLAIF
jgi:hypothetical protein